MGVLQPVIDERFHDRISKKVDGCWIWIAARTSAGYGEIRIDGRLHYVHRLSWEIANGESIPEGMCVLHVCDHPACVNPSHLFLGTHGDNIRDARAKDRIGKTSKRDRRFLRKAYAVGFTQQRLAEMFGLSQRGVSKIVRGEVWA